MKVDGESRGVTTVILNHEISRTGRLTHGEGPWYPLGRRMGQPQIPIEIRTPDRPARR